MKQDMGQRYVHACLEMQIVVLTIDKERNILCTVNIDQLNGSSSRSRVKVEYLSSRRSSSSGRNSSSRGSGGSRYDYLAMLGLEP